MPHTADSIYCPPPLQVHTNHRKTPTDGEWVALKCCDDTSCSVPMILPIYLPEPGGMLIAGLLLLAVLGCTKPACEPHVYLDPEMHPECEEE